MQLTCKEVLDGLELNVHIGSTIQGSKLQGGKPLRLRSIIVTPAAMPHEGRPSG